MQTPAVLAGEQPRRAVPRRAVGRCRGCRRLQGIGRVAAQDVTVLIMGETARQGTGRPGDLPALARATQSRSPDHQLRAIPEPLLRERDVREREGRLHRGRTKRSAKFEQCRRNHFLGRSREQGRMTQVKGCGVEGARVRRSAATRTVRTDCAHRRHKRRPGSDAEGRFRQDLYFRNSTSSPSCLPPPARARRRLPDAAGLLT